MIVKTVKLSSKGQITIPAEVLASLGADKGTEFVVVQEGEQLLLIPSDRVGELLREELPDWEALAGPAFQDLWDNEADEVWDAA